MESVHLEEQNFQRSLTSRDEYIADEVLYEEDDKLSLFEKIKHNKWQLRRKAYFEIAELLAAKKLPLEVDGEHLTVETIAPLLQNMIYEPNLIALGEGLKAIKAFFANYYLSRSYLAAFTTSLIDKLVLTKTSIQNAIMDIFDKLIEMDENSIPSEILKRLDNKNHKFLNAILNILLKYLKKKANIEDSTLRNCFKGILPMISHQNKETRHLSFEILKIIYSYIEESYDDLLSFAFCEMRSYHLKELEGLQKCKKNTSRKLFKLNDGTFKAGVENSKKPLNPEQKVDLATLMPDKYLEIPYISNGQNEGKNLKGHQQNEKKKKLEEFNQKIEHTLKSGMVIDGSKDYSFIINLMILMLEDKNILINQEATRTVSHLLKICKSNFPQAKLKHIVTLIIEKLDMKKKTAYNNSLHTLLEESIMYRCLAPESLCDILLFNAESNKNLNVRISCLQWFSGSFVSLITEKKDAFVALLNDPQDAIKNEKASVSASTKNAKLLALSSLKADDRISKLVTNIYRKTQQILKKENNVLLKKACQDLLDRLQFATSPYGPRESNPELMNNLNDISAIKGSKVVNVSNISIPHMDSMYHEKLDTDDFKETEPDQFMMERFSHNESSKRSEFSFENLKPEDREQYKTLINAFNEIKSHDEHLIDKLEGVLGIIEKTSMEVIQTCQVALIKKLKKIIYINSSERKNILQFFDLAHVFMIKLNKICVEILPATLKIELKILLLFLSNVLTSKSIEKILDSAYMTCPIDRFLAVTLKIFEKLDKKYIHVIPLDKVTNSLRIYLNWLALKIEKAQSVMFEESQVRMFERAYSQFRFVNIPQLHVGVTALLSKKIKQQNDENKENHSGSIEQSRTYETPRIRKHKPLSIEPNAGGSRMDDITEIEQSQLSQKLKSIEVEIRSNLQGGLEKFSSLLSSIKKKNLERSYLSNCLSPSHLLSPNRHWKRGVGREGTPPKKSLRSSIMAQQDDSRNKYLCTLNIDDVSTIVDNICAYISERELGQFEDTLYKLKCICSPKDLMQVFKTMLNRILSKEIYGERISKENVLKLVINFMENLDKGLILITLRDFFSVALKNNYRAIVTNCARMAIELVLSAFNSEDLPKKHVSYLVEIIVYGLSEIELKPRAETLLFNILKKISKEDLRRMFELELINSIKLYQVFLYWIDGQEAEAEISAPDSPLQKKNDEILILDEQPALDDHSLSRTPEKSELKHSKTYEEVFEGTQHKDLKQLALTLMADEKPEDLEIKSKENTDEKMKHAGFTFKQSTNSEFGFSELGGVLGSANRLNNKLTEHMKGGRKILGERDNLDLGTFSKLDSSKGSNKENLDDNKENLNFNKPSVSLRYSGEDSAEKWKTKYIQEKEKLQATIDLLEKANNGYLAQVTDKTELLNKLENQRKINESLLEKFNEYILIIS